MKPGFVRTSIDVPQDLHRRLHEAAVKHGCSARQLILKGVERAVADSAPARMKHRLSLETPIVRTRGKKFNLTNEEIYDLLGLP